MWYFVNVYVFQFLLCVYVFYVTFQYKCRFDVSSTWRLMDVEETSCFFVGSLYTADADVLENGFFFLLRNQIHYQFHHIVCQFLLTIYSVCAVYMYCAMYGFSSIQSFSGWIFQFVVIWISFCNSQINFEDVFGTAQVYSCISIHSFVSCLFTWQLSTWTK